MKKAKKLTKEQKMTDLLRSQDVLIRDLKGREEYLERKISSRDKDIEELGEKMNANAEIFQDRLTAKDYEISRLMEIIKWQIKPESALQDNSKKSMTTGCDPFAGRFKGCC